MNTGQRIMKKFDTLYVNGCSLTFGMEVGYTGLKRTREELTIEENTYREANNWAGVLSKRLRIPMIQNDGQSGRSNNTIFRTTIHALNANPQLFNDKTLVVLGWTSLNRVDFHNGNKDFTINLIPESRTRYDDKTKRLFDCLVDDGFHNRTLEGENLSSYSQSLFSLLEGTGATVVQFSAIDNALQSNHNGFAPGVFYEECINRNFPCGEYWHPGVEGHTWWASQLLNHIQKIT